MKRLPTLFLTTLLLAIASQLTTAAQAADKVSISATLILGSNEGGGVDSHLKRYERHLKRVFRFDTFTQKGRGSSSVTTPGSGMINIGGGHSVSVKIEEASGGKLRMTARWTNGGRILINTTVVTSRNQPTVLGGPSSGNGKLILLLEAR